MNYVFKSVLVSVLLLSASDAFASGEKCVNQDTFGASNSLEELIAESSFIGIYKSEKLSATLNEKSCCRFSSQIFEIEFDLVHSLKGEAPKLHKTKTSVDVLNTVPSSFFRLHDEHARLVEKQRSLGLHSENSSSFRTKTGNCYFGPSAVVNGYEYLIFGGVNSPVAVEPILNKRTDPFFLAVKSVLSGNE